MICLGEDAGALNGAIIKASRKEIFMITIPLKPERMEALEDYAKRHGQAPADALDEVVANYLDWENQDYQEAVQGVARGLQDVEAGRTRPAKEFLDELCAKHGISR
jgi:predicted transcriptional regulator